MRVRSVDVLLQAASSLAKDQKTVVNEDHEPVVAIDYAAPAGATTAAMVTGGGMCAESLVASFLIQRMSITRMGQYVLCWGARITSIDRDSPLKNLGVRSGDVITRLDGIRIDNGMFRNSRGEIVAPELDRHFGGTEVRFIVSGTSKVLIGQILIADANSGGVVAP